MVNKLKHYSYAPITLKSVVVIKKRLKNYKKTIKKQSFNINTKIDDVFNRRM